MRFLSITDGEPGVIAIGGEPVGIIAIGGAPTGVLAIGSVARGIVAIGFVSIGIFAVACGGAFGLVTLVCGGGSGLVVAGVGLGVGLKTAVVGAGLDFVEEDCVDRGDWWKRVIPGCMVLIGALLAAWIYLFPMMVENMQEKSAAGPKAAEPPAKQLSAEEPPSYD